MILEPWEENIETLDSIECVDNFVVLHFKNIYKIFVPKKCFSEIDLDKFVGNKIGLLNADGIYKIRKIK